MLEPLTPERIESIVSSAIDDATDFIETEVSPNRIKAQKYYGGEVDVSAEEGRSQVVSTIVRDKIRAVKPAIMRSFLQGGAPVEFVPRGPDDVAAAEQATEYVNYLFHKANGYRIVSDAIHDALLKKTGIVKARYKEDVSQEIHTLDAIGEDVLAAIAADENAEVLSVEQREDGLFMAKVAIDRPGGKICIESVPPEEFFVDSEANTLDDCYVCGHRTEGRIADLLDMGFDYEDVKDLDADDSDARELEDFERDGHYDETDEANLDPSMRRVTITEAYMRMDVEGTGKPQLYQFICGGTANRVLSMELADEIPFAVFEIDPEPHTFFGHSMYDLVAPDQDVSTSLLRSVIDNAHMTNNPRMFYDITKVDGQDAMNNEVGGIVKVNGSPMDAVREVAVPFTAGTILPFMQYYGETIDQRSGVSQASSGMDADALRNTTATAADMMRSAVESHVEVIARNLAEGGMKQLFRLLLRLSQRHPDQAAMMRLRGQFVPVNPASWDVEMDMTVSVGLGTAGRDKRSAVLREALQLQLSLIQQAGPTNGLATFTNVRAVLEDILEDAGIYNTERYFQPMEPQREEVILALQQQVQQLTQQLQQSQQPDQTAAYMQAEQMKMQGRLQEAQMREQSRQQVEQMKLAADAQMAAREDDRKRDADDAKVILEAAKIFGQYGVQVDESRIAEAQNAPRP